MRLFRNGFALCLAAILALAAPAATAAGADAGLVRLGSRVFDLRTDASKLRRGPDFIPMNEIRWLGPLLDADPALFDTVFHINQMAMDISNYVGDSAHLRKLYPYTQDIPERFRLDGYDVRSETAGNDFGFYYLPRMPSPHHAVSCVRDRRRDAFFGCIVYADYPPDPHIQLQSRIYNPKSFKETAKRFEAVARRMREIAYCLDVTDELEGRRDLDERHDLAACDRERMM